ncbi:TonB-dependent receptor domain-containing protein [Aquimonas voraii]|uniref:Iron complex outermembrane recepter protein n=1 Tax=Aquimonas voraii TaxID=265719 RepID=A0A1G6YZB7_9GAMM|nr:TonB-dependent receptor [Aquimonas voraii]SDD94985.1 iron complex outermembrane recepter protein [Aquimonas voraii]
MSPSPRLLAAAVALAMLPAAFADASQRTRLPNVVVLGALPPSPAEPALDRDALSQGAAADLAEVLRGISGLAASRMGGHGLEPSIRGQSQGQINVRLDGMELHGACPNRMDPPTAFAQPSAIDRVTVQKGVQSLRNGPGGSGGAILIERRLPWEAQGLEGRIALNAGDNAEFWQAAADVGGARGGTAWRVLASREDRESYEDGAGSAVRSALARDAVSLLLGQTWSEAQRSELNLDYNDTRDVLYAGAGMDAPKDRLGAWKLAHYAKLGGASLRASAWSAEVDHVMDNFSLRQQTGMFMRVPASADSSGLELAAEFAIAGWNLEIGLQQAKLERLAIRSAGMNPDTLTMRNALLWPQAELQRRGLFIEAQGPLSADTQLTAGLRLDRFDADALRAGERVNMSIAAPADFYRSYYGVSATGFEDDGLGALLRFDHALNARLQLFAGLSRSVRAADSTERYIASTSGAGPARWIGNPQLANELHQQFDAGLIWQSEAARYSLVAYLDRVDDYILRDRARGQPGLVLADGASVYRNVDAELHGAEFEAEWTLDSGLRIDAQLDYVRGENRSDGRALAQIAPLSVALGVRQSTSLGEFSARLRGADRQDRVDASTETGSGLDARRTPGWAVLDLGWTLERGAQRLRIGLDNVFDRAYAEHLNRANQDPFNPTPVQVNEPGRSLRLGWEYRF